MKEPRAGVGPVFNTQDGKRYIEVPGNDGAFEPNDAVVYMPLADYSDLMNELDDLRAMYHSRTYQPFTVKGLSLTEAIEAEPPPKPRVNWAKYRGDK